MFLGQLVPDTFWQLHTPPETVVCGSLPTWTNRLGALAAATVRELPPTKTSVAVGSAVTSVTDADADVLPMRATAMNVSERPAAEKTFASSTSVWPLSLLFFPLTATGAEVSASVTDHETETADERSEPHSEYVTEEEMRRGRLTSNDPSDTALIVMMGSVPAVSFVEHEQSRMLSLHFPSWHCTWSESHASMALHLATSLTHTAGCCGQRTLLASRHGQLVGLA